MLQQPLNPAVLQKISLICTFFCLSLICGCGTMKTSNTSRTATEQLLISDAIDKAVNQLDFRVLAGKNVYLNTTCLTSVTDTNYLASSIRQQLLASGAMLKEEKKDAEYIVEVRSGGIGTDENDIIYGMPKTTMPTFVSSGTVTIPEIAIAKKVAQTANAKIAVFAYNRETGVPLWQSGTSQSNSRIKNVWVLGGGPYRSGDIIDRPEFASQAVDIPIAELWENKKDASSITLKDQAYFVQNDPEKKDKNDVPVLRLASPAQQPDLAGRIVRPEGLYIPTEEKLLAFPSNGASPAAAQLADQKSNTEPNKDKSENTTKQVAQKSTEKQTEKADPNAQIADSGDKTTSKNPATVDPGVRPAPPQAEIAQPPVNTLR